jgi:hypothetical protein
MMELESQRFRTAKVLLANSVEAEITTVVKKLGSSALAIAKAVDQRMVAAAWLV